MISSMVFYPFSNKWWGVFRAYTFKPFVFLKHGEKKFHDINFDISISTWSPSAPCNRGFKSRWPCLGSSEAEPWLAGCRLWLYQSLLPSPEVSGEGAAFPEVSDGKRYYDVSGWFRKALPKPCVVWRIRLPSWFGNWGRQEELAMVYVHVLRKT